MSLFSHPFALDFLGAALLLGGAGMGWWFWRYLGEWRQLRAAQAEARRRQVLREARRARAAHKRQRRQTLGQEKQRQRARQNALRAAERLEAHQQAQMTMAWHEARQAAIEAEAARLCALPEPHFWAELATLFAQRGWTPQNPDPEAPGDFWLKSPDQEACEVARCVPAGLPGRRTDVRALELWRQQVGASRAYLVARTGFTPEAVREADGLAITLVEAYLLAHWQTETEPAGS